MGHIIYEDLIFHEKKENFSPKHAKEIFKKQSNVKKKKKSMEGQLKA